MSRRLYYRDSYGRWQRDRQSERNRSRGGGQGQGLPAKFAVKALLVVALIVVIGSLMQSFYQAIKP